MIVCPATVTVPDREGPLSVAMFSVTVPEPLPVAPDAIVTQSTLLAAVQGQPVEEVTATVRVPPDAPSENVLGVTE